MTYTLKSSDELKPSLTHNLKVYYQGKGVKDYSELKAPRQNQAKLLEYICQNLPQDSDNGYILTGAILLIINEIKAEYNPIHFYFFSSAKNSKLHTLLNDLLAISDVSEIEKDKQYISLRAFNDYLSAQVFKNPQKKEEGRLMQNIFYKEINSAFIDGCLNELAIKMHELEPEVSSKSAVPDACTSEDTPSPVDAVLQPKEEHTIEPMLNEQKNDIEQTGYPSETKFLGGIIGMVSGIFAQAPYQPVNTDYIDEVNCYDFT